jgi:acetolactate synthase I/II/III large subunit
MTKLSDYVIQFLVDRGIHDIFLVSGGGIMHVLDSVGRNEGMRHYCNYHEQACVIGAEAYARLTGKVGAALVTVGPGAANAVSALPGSWVDSIPILVISGQVRQDLIADYSKLRQLGPQETNTLGMAKPVTKYAVRVTDPKRIRYELEAAYYHATEGRPGPVWVELPLDVQGASIDESTLEGFDPPVDLATARVTEDVRAVIDAIRNSKRPIIVPGNGVRLSNSEPLLRELLDRTQIPVVVPFSAKDLVEEDYPRYVGVFGTAGQRRANFAIQNSDCMIALGAGLNTQKVGFNYKGFAPKAKKIILDIDPRQILHQVLPADMPIECDVRVFLEEFLRESEGIDLRPPANWLEACANWKRRYPVITPEYFDDPDHVNSYVFMDEISNLLEPSDTIIAGAGLDIVSCYQAFKVKRGQRVIISAWGSMGWDLPLTIGACIAAGRKRTVCITGDGSIQWNIQELLSIAKNRLPLKIFIFNNEGYSSIRATQNSFFDGRFVGADFGSGLANPDFSKLAAVYGFRYFHAPDNASLRSVLPDALAAEGVTICEINLAKDQTVSPKASAYRRPDGTFESRPLEDMAPFLSREEVYENMHLFDEELVDAPELAKS